jgi:hypothetical protein
MLAAPVAFETRRLENLRIWFLSFRMSSQLTRRPSDLVLGIHADAQ